MVLSSSHSCWLSYGLVRPSARTFVSLLWIIVLIWWSYPLSESMWSSPFANILHGHVFFGVVWPSECTWYTFNLYPPHSLMGLFSTQEVRGLIHLSQGTLNRFAISLPFRLCVAFLYLVVIIVANWFLVCMFLHLEFTRFQADDSFNIPCGQEVREHNISTNNILTIRHPKWVCSFIQ